MEEILEPSNLVKISILKKNIETCRANRYSLFLLGQGAKKIGDNQAAEGLNVRGKKATEELKFYLEKLNEIEKKE